MGTIHNTQKLLNSGYLRIDNNPHPTLLFLSKSSEYQPSQNLLLKFRDGSKI